MNWFLSLFLKKNLEIEQPAIFNTAFIKEPQIVFDTNEIKNWPEWLADEQALRDEAVIFGFTNSAMDEKIQTIEAYYHQLGIQPQKRLGQYDEKILELNLEQEAKDQAIKVLEGKQKVAIESKTKESHLLRFLLGLALSIAMCAGIYFLIAEWLLSSFKNNARWISWGIFLTGMFNLFSPISFLHENIKPTWRQLLEGVGVPFATAFLVFILTYEQYGLLKSGGMFLFLFFTFIFSGKLLLGNIINLVKEFKVIKENFKLNSDRKLAETAWKLEINKLEKDILNLRADKWKIKPELDSTTAELQRLNSEKNATINLFKSEFNLAARFANENRTQIIN
jgi:hypothetical protein